MKNALVILLAIATFAGLATAARVLNERSEPRVAQGGPAAAHFDQSADIGARIAALEAAVAEERDARQTLEDELLALYEELDRLAADARPPPRPAAEDAGSGAPDVRVSQRASRNDAERRRDRLVEAGFQPDRADWLLQRESELQMASMQRVFELRQAGEPIDRFDAAVNPGEALRAEIGDPEYERYLAANGQSTAVTVSSVMESSPAQSAGLQPGDRILSYDGQRVFNTWELNRRIMQGAAGETVVVNVLRDGVPMQIVLPRGPMGITSRRGRGPR